MTRDRLASRIEVEARAFKHVASGEGVRIPHRYWLASSGLGLLLVALLWAGIPEFESAFGRDGSSVRRAGRVPLEVGGLWPGPQS